MLWNKNRPKLVEKRDKKYILDNSLIYIFTIERNNPEDERMMTCYP